MTRLKIREVAAAKKSIVMLSEAKHLAAEHERPFAAAQGDREGKHLIASLPMEREPFKILTAETLDKLAKVFGVDASELIERCTG